MLFNELCLLLIPPPLLPGFHLFLVTTLHFVPLNLPRPCRSLSLCIPHRIPPRLCRFNARHGLTLKRIRSPPSPLSHLSILFGLHLEPLASVPILICENHFNLICNLSGERSIPHVVDVLNVVLLHHGHPVLAHKVVLLHAGSGQPSREGETKRNIITAFQSSCHNFRLLTGSGAHNEKLMFAHLYLMFRLITVHKCCKSASLQE